MNKKLSLVLIGMLTVAAQAREIRTPLSITSRGYNHYPLPWPIEEDATWGINFWGLGLHRDSDKAFVDKNSVATESLAGLYFGAPSFTIGQAFPVGTAFPGAPLASVATITPNFGYSENTAVVGFDVGAVVGCNSQWNIVVSDHLPFRAINVTLDDCCDLTESLAAGDFGGTQFENITNPATGIVQTIQTYAYRMDFVSAINEEQAGVLPYTPFTNYAAVPSLTMHGINVTNSNATPQNGGTGTVGSGRPIQVIATPIGTRPIQFGSVPAEVTVALPADGTLATGQHAYFDSATSYLPLSANVANQDALWLTSVVVDSVGNPGNIAQTDVSDAVFSRLTALAATLPPVTNFLGNLGLNFASQRRYQVGDLDAEFYINRYFCDWFLEGVAGLRFPTGRDITASQLGNVLMAQTPTGNNHHVEVHLGGIVGWQPTEWLAIKVDGYFNHAFNHTESLAASFTGATINNLGSAVRGQVNWSYFVGDIDFTFMPPGVCPELGIDVGYQAYVKGTDRVNLQQTAIVPFAGGVLTALSAANIEARTFRIAHKAKAELFYQACNWQIYSGFTHTFAGRNITRDTDVYLGTVVYF